MEARAITDDEVPAFRECLLTTFGEDADADPDGDRRFRALIAPGQAWAAFDRGTVVGTAGTLELQLGMPGGGTLAMAGLTMVTVRPSHRRRGILRQLMQHYLDDARARGRRGPGHRPHAVCSERRAREVLHEIANFSSFDVDFV